MAVTEFDDTAHWGLFLTNPNKLDSSTVKRVRESELTLAALRASGLLDNMEDGTTAPVDTSKLWLDKNFDPAVLKEWNPVGAAWEQVTSQTLFGRVPWRGEWDNTWIYRRADVVSYNGAIWIAVQPSQNHPPAEDAYWDLFLESAADNSVSTAKLQDNSVTNAKLADMATATIKGRVTAGTGDPEDLTPAQARNMLDPLKDFNADGVTDDTTNWADLRALYPGTTIDCRGQKFKVTAIPSGPVRNGWWVIDSYDGDATVEIPMPGTIRATRQRITNNFRYNAWSQDAGRSYKNVIVVPYNEGVDHTGTGGDMSAWQARSYDGGFTYTQYERVSTNASEQRYCFSGGFANGQELFIFRHGVTATDNRLYGRRFFERVNSVTCDIDHVNGQPTYVFNLPGTGLKNGDVVTITNFGTVAGQGFSGDFTVSAVTATGFTLTAGGNANATGTTSNEFRIQYVEGALAQLTFGGLSIDGAVQAASGGTFVAPLVLFHSMETDGADNPAMYTCVHKDQLTGVWLVKASDVLLSTRSIAWVRQINTEGVEATVARVPGSSRLVGGIRTQSVASYPLRLWFSDDELATAAHFIDAPGSEFGEQSPVPCRVIGDYIYWFISGKRTRDGTAGTVGLYLIRILAAELDVTTVWDDLEVMRIGTAYYSAMEVNAVGVPSMAFTDEALILMYSSEHPPIVSDTDGQPEIYTIRIELDASGDFKDFDFDTNADYPLTFSAPWTDTANVVGPITASHSYPAGGIVERGSVTATATGGGEYIKWADGTMECWHNTFTITQTGADTMEASWTLPAAFSSSTSASITLPNTGASYTGAARTALGSPYSNLGTTTITIGFNRASGAASFAAGNNVVNCRVRAIGRWY